MYTTREKEARVKIALVNGRSYVRKCYKIPESTLRGWMKTYDQNCAFCDESLSTMWKEKRTIELIQTAQPFEEYDVFSLVGECCRKLVGEQKWWEASTLDEIDKRIILSRSLRLNNDKYFGWKYQ